MTVATHCQHGTDQDERARTRKTHERRERISRRVANASGIAAIVVAGAVILWHILALSRTAEPMSPTLRGIALAAIILGAVTWLVDWAVRRAARAHAIELADVRAELAAVTNRIDSLEERLGTRIDAAIARAWRQGHHHGYGAATAELLNDDFTPAPIPLRRTSVESLPAANGRQRTR